MAFVARSAGGGNAPMSSIAADTVLARAEEIAVASAAEASAVDREDGFPTEAFRRIGEQGLLAAPLASERGGLGLGSDPGTAHTLLLLLLRIGWGNLSVGRVYEGHVNALHLVEAFGTAEQIRACARDVLDGGKLFAVWNTEVEGGVKLFPLSRGRSRLEGAKVFASGAGHVQRPLITATLPDGGRQLCLLPLDQLTARLDPGWWQPLGMRASASYRVDFSGIELDDSALIGAPGDYVRQPWFTGGAVRFAAVQLGGAQALFDAACTYLRDMGRTEDPYQQTRAGAMAIAIAGGEFWLRGAAEAMECCLPLMRPGIAADDDAATALMNAANMTRTAIERICLDVLELAERAVGARALLRPHPFERQIRDLRTYLRQPAPDAALESVGRDVLSQSGPRYEARRHAG